jgi:hypothetical protein
MAAKKRKIPVISKLARFTCPNCGAVLPEEHRNVKGIMACSGKKGEWVLGDQKGDLPCTWVCDYGTFRPTDPREGLFPPPKRTISVIGAEEEDIAKIDFDPSIGLSFHRKRKKPLTETERFVLEIIRSQPAGQGIAGKDICIRMRDKPYQTPIAENTLTTHIIPKLKAAGLIESGGPGRGYYPS